MSEGQVVNGAREGNNPAVEESFWGGLLTAKVIDYEDAVVGLHLQRCTVDTG